MDKTRFEVGMTPLAGGPGPCGADEASFLISPNPGEDLKPLEKIASGGELSRIMLALRGLLAGEGDVGSLVFDEVDAGIGGSVSEAVGLRMKKMSHGRQVLCVTHLARIASLADTHLGVVKREKGGRTGVKVEVLGPDDRIEEIARMLAGAEITETSRAHAKEMLGLSGKR